MTRLKNVGLLLLAGIFSGCDSTLDSRVSAVESTPTAFNVAGAPVVEFSAPDMMCPEGCGEKVKEILSEQPGAKEVVINFEAKTAMVAVDKDKFDTDAAIAALVDHGFDHSSLKSADAEATSAAESAKKPAG